MNTIRSYIDIINELKLGGRDPASLRAAAAAAATAAQPSQPNTGIQWYVCSNLKLTISNYPNLKETFKARIISFIDAKISLSNDGRKPIPRIGNTDEPLAGKDYPAWPPGSWHYHVAEHNYSLVYFMVGGKPPMIKLFGVYSHDHMGTGSKKNPRLQKSIGDKLARMRD